MEEITIKRTPELEDYMVAEAFAMATLGNTLTEYLSEELYKKQKEKVLSKKDLRYIIAQVVLQYDAQFGINRYKDDPVMSRKIYEHVKKLEKEGKLEVVKEEDGDKD